MSMNSFVFDVPVEGHYHTQWEAPSNIALIKYWGKYRQQLPQNPSISFTLSKCVTSTEIIFSPREDGVKAFEFLFDQKKTTRISPQDSKVFEAYHALFPSFAKPPLIYIEPKLLPS